MPTNAFGLLKLLACLPQLDLCPDGLGDIRGDAGLLERRHVLLPEDLMQGVAGNKLTYAQLLSCLSPKLPIP